MVNIENTIKNFVLEYNKKYSQHPIVVFDFVSLDNEGKLMWWTYNIEEVNEGYKKFVLDFIGTGDSKKTLIKTEYDRDTFSYFELGNSALITDVENKTFQFAKQEDPIGIDDNFNNTLPDREVIEAYEKLFKEKFKNGSTIWVSLPHTDNKNRKVYSAIFTLFNYKIDNKQNQLETYRTFRDFIVTYLIELYKAPVEEQRRLVTRAYTSLAKKVDKIFLFSTPSGAKWNDLEMSFDENNLDIVWVTVKKIREVKSYAEMGFKNMRTGLPNELWKRLLEFRKGNIKYSADAREKVESDISRLRKSLKKYFGIEENPINLKHGYEPAFKVNVIERSNRSVYSFSNYYEDEKEANK